MVPIDALLSSSWFRYISLYLSINRAILSFFYILFDTTFNLFLFFGILISSICVIASLSRVFIKQEGEEEIRESSKLPFVTVQIPTRNEIVALRCAKKCLDFDYPKDKYEILIGDDSSKEAISRKLDEFATKHKHVKIIRREANIGFKPGNLNNMLKYSRGKIIVLFDSDFVPERDFLSRIIAPFMHDKEISAVQARWKFINAEKNLITILASAIVYTFHHVSLSILKKFNSGFICGSAEAIRKSDLIKYGGWKSGSLTEDIEYSLRLHKYGKRIHYLPHLECYNEAPSRPIDLYKQQMRWAYGVISSYKEHARDIVVSDTLSLKQKLTALVGAFGYLIPIVLFFSFIAGTGSLLTHTPAPMEWARFLTETSRNILLTSGLLIANSVALYRARKAKLLGRMLVSSFSFGLIVTYYVNIGILKAIMNSPMNWYLLKKSKSTR